MTWVATAVIGGAVIGAGASIYSANKGADAVGDSTATDLQLQRQIYNQNREDATPYREAGYTALDATMALMGLPSPGRAVSGGLDYRSSSLGFPTYGTISGDDVVRGFETFLGERPTQYQIDYYTGKRSDPSTPLRERASEFYNDIIAPNIDRVRGQQPSAVEATVDGRPTPAELLSADPGYQHRVNETMRALESSAAARSGYGTPFTRRAVRDIQGVASQEYMKLYNRLTNVAGLGQVATGATMNAGIAYAGNAGRAIGDAGATRASAYVAQGNAISNAFGQAGQGLGYWYGRQNPYSPAMTNRPGGYNWSRGAAQGPAPYGRT